MSASDVTVRRADPADRPAVEDALEWAVNWSSERVPLERSELLARPEIAHYVAGWPGPREHGVVAERAGRPVGAAWWRFLPADDPGYGFVADDVPELSIGVDPGHRGQGIGRRLLRFLLAVAEEEGIAQLSLSVERTNRARELYLSEGFRIVGVTADADTMLIGRDAC